MSNLKERLNKEQAMNSSARKQTNAFIQGDYAELEAKVVADAVKSGNKIPSNKITYETMYGKSKKFSLDEPPRSERLTAKIERTTGCGCSFNSVDCPKCEKLIILDGMDLRIMSTICKKCHCVFNLET